MLAMSQPAEDPRFIPTSVRAAVSIRNAAEDPRIEGWVIEDMVAAEPVVAAALLRVANSAAHRRSAPVVSPADAVRRLGLVQVRAVASRVAMWQLVHGIRGRVERIAAEGLLLHSISAAAFAARLASAAGGLDGDRVESLALFHELPLFAFLARADRERARCETLSELSADVGAHPLVTYEQVMQDLGLAELAVIGRREQAVLDGAHRYLARPNPVLAHPFEGFPGDEIDPEEAASIQAEADACYVLLVEGAVPRSERLPGQGGTRSGTDRPSSRPAVPTGWLAHLRRSLSAWLRR